MFYTIIMVELAQKRKFSLLIICLVLVHVAIAQPAPESSDFSQTEYQDFGTYYERITYIGRRKDHYIVDTYLKDSVLNRTDNYRVIAQGSLFAQLSVRHGPAKVFYSNGRLYLTCDYNMNELNGPFIVYHTDGSVKRRELYQSGRLKKSKCYDLAGNEKVCEAFYQPLKFKGNPDDLKAYFKKSLLPILIENGVINTSIRLSINEIGQVVNVLVGGNLDNPRFRAAVRKVVQDMPPPCENETNWTPATVDGSPISGIWEMYANRDGTRLRITFPKL